MDIIQSPPPSEIIALCDSVDRVIEAYLMALQTGTIKLGRFEAEVEAYTLQKLIIRHAEAMVLMARHDLVLLPSAVLCARSVFETHVRIRWMLKPIDPFERESRWVAHLRSASDHWRKLADDVHIGEAAKNQFLDQKNRIDSFAGDISALLAKQNYKASSTVPKMREMLKELDEPYLYSAYVIMSAYVHSNFVGASHYRKNLGDRKALGEYITAQDWAFPIEIVWKSLFVVSGQVLNLVEAKSGSFPDYKLMIEFEALLSALKAKSGA